MESIMENSIDNELPNELINELPIPAEDEYETPYLITVVHDGSLLQAAIAINAGRSQVCKVTDKQLPLIEYLTPDVLLFEQSIDNLMETAKLLLDKGYQRILILGESVASELTASELTSNKQIIYLNADNITEYIIAEDHQAAYLLEYVMGAEIPGYIHRGGISTQECQYFATGMLFNQQSTIERTIIDFCDLGYKCYDRINEYITIGRVLTSQIEDKIADGCNYSIDSNTILAINCEHDDYVINTIKLLKAKRVQSVDYLLLYSATRLDESFVWGICLMRLSTNQLLPNELFAKYYSSNMVTKNNNTSIGYANVVSSNSSNSSNNLMPF